MNANKWVGMLGVVAMALLLSPTWAAADSVEQGELEDTLVVIADLVEFKTSPNVRATLSSDSATFGDGIGGTTYVAATVHRAGDRAYGVDPDYTGMYVQNVTVGDWEATLGTLPDPQPGSNSDFTGDWVAK